jgi:hypothetical protein
MHLSSGISSFDTEQNWEEARFSQEVIGVYNFRSPGVPTLFGDPISVPVFVGVGSTHADPDSCNSWPNEAFPSNTTFPDPPPFHVTVDWAFPNVPLSSNGLLGLCLTVQGVVTRTCVHV